MKKLNNLCEFCQLVKEIRSGRCANNPALISRYFQLQRELAARMSPAQAFELYRSSFHLLMDTICDDLIPYHWRQMCLDSIFMALCRMQNCIENVRQRETLKKCHHELRICSHYFMV